MLMATSVGHPTSVQLAYAPVALPGIGNGTRERIFGINEPFPTATTAARKWDVRSAKRLFPKVRSETRPICPLRGCESQTSPTQDKTSLNIVSLGNDPRRDWKLLIEVVRGRQDWSLKIASQKVERSALSNSSNVEIVGWKTNDEWLARHRWADAVEFAIKPNLHASGITIIQEAALQGVPVICSDTGGLRAYFWTQQSEAALREAIGAFADKRDVRLSFARRTQDRMGPYGLSSESFVRGQVELSRDLLSLDAPSEAHSEENDA